MTDSAPKGADDEELPGQGQIEEREVDADLGQPPEGDEIEQEAREYGWTPLDQWKGNKDLWKPAAEFLKRMKRHPAVVMERERGDKLERQVGDLNEKLDAALTETKQIGESFGNFVEMNRTAAQKEYERGLRDAKRKRDDAAMLGDTQAYQTANLVVEEIERERPEVPAASAPKPAAEKRQPETPAPAAPAAPKISRTAQDWIDGNQRIMNDEVLYAIAKSAHQERLDAGMSESESFETLATEVKKRAPWKFQNPARNAPAPVRSPSGQGGPRKKAQGYDDLPPEVKKTCDSQHKWLVAKKPDYTKDEWAREYFASQGQTQGAA